MDTVDFSGISQAILYEDNGLEVLYKDKSILQISPCGANFRFTRSPRSEYGEVPALGREVTQRCIFSTSETRSKVVQAIIIRNQICSSPYIPQDLLIGQGCTEVLELFENVAGVEWHVGSEQGTKTSNGTIHIDESGEVTVTSVNSHAKLTLFPDHHKVKVTYLAKTSRSGNEIGKGEQKPAPHKSKQSYVWQSTIFPTCLCPEAWKPALEIAKRQATGCASTDEVDQRKSAVPRSLPLICSRQFTHQWRDVLVSDSADEAFSSGTGSDISLPIKCEESVRQFNVRMLWSDGVTYWITSKSNEPAAIEVWLDNGQILKSHPSSERSYTLLYQSPQSSNRGFHERAITASALPQQDLTLRSVLLRAMRLQMYCRTVPHSTLTDARRGQCCWLENEPSPGVDQHSGAVAQGSGDFDEILNPSANNGFYEKVTLENIGLFSAVDDSIQITFTDGTLLYMTLDVAGQRETKNFDLVKTECRLLFADGHCAVLKNLPEPSTEATPYANYAVKWCEWLMKPVCVRREQPFLCDTIHASVNTYMVQLEIEKNQRFNHLLSVNPSLASKIITSSSDSIEKMNSEQQNEQCMSYRDVCDAMSQTSKAIDDIDLVIKALK